MADATIWSGGTTGPKGPQGDPGPSIEIQVTSTHIQWRVVGDAVWINLIALVDLEGPQGTIGPQGVQGVKGDTGEGSQILSGIGVPDDVAHGVNGDWYLDTSEGHLYGPKASGTWPGTFLDLKGSGLQALLTDYRIATQNLDWAGAVIYDVALGNSANITLSGQVTGISYSNWPAGNNLVKLDLTIVQGATPFDIASWGVTKWFGGFAPMLGVNNGDVDHVVIYSLDGGTVKIGAHVGTAS